MYETAYERMERMLGPTNACALRAFVREEVRKAMLEAHKPVNEVTGREG